MKKLLIILTILTMFGCSTTPPEENSTKELFENLESDKSLTQATFAGGCFWCTEASLQELDGVEEALSGYAGGEEVNPTYEEVVAHKTSHREALRAYYHAGEITYEQILDAFWNAIDPLDPDGQYTDRGFNYSTAIFYHNEEQKTAAEKSKTALSEKLGQEVVTEILPLSSFYPAEDFHQDFYKHSAERYQRYKKGSGRK